jgi:TolA-binding protein
MSLKNVSNLRSGLRHAWFVFLSLAAFLLIGCGGSEEATTESNPQEAGKPLGTVEQEKPKEAKPMDQALTNFIGTDTERAVVTTKPAAVAPAQLSQYEKQIEDLNTENTILKQKNIKLEQENRGINARLSETETKYSVEKLRADRAEELAKTAAHTPMMAEEKPTPEKSVNVAASTSAYDNAIHAFNTRRYNDAAKGFSAIISSSTNDDLTNRAEYWLGETNFAQKKYKDALSLFQNVLKNKNSEKKADAQFMIGQTYERLGD